MAEKKNEKQIGGFLGRVEDELLDWSALMPEQGEGWAAIAGVSRRGLSGFGRSAKIMLKGDNGHLAALVADIITERPEVRHIAERILAGRDAWRHSSKPESHAE